MIFWIVTCASTRDLIRYVIFQFSKFSPKLLTYRWDTLYVCARLTEMERTLSHVCYSTKGQLISKELFDILNSSKKRKKIFDLTTMIPQVDLFSYVFWKNLKTPKRHFEIHWPLWFSTVIWQFIDLIHVSTIYFSFEKWNRHMGIIYRYKAGLVFSQTIFQMKLSILFHSECSAVLGYCYL